jgi:hypothetical protein
VAQLKADFEALVHDNAYVCWLLPECCV